MAWFPTLRTTPTAEDSRGEFPLLPRVPVYGIRDKEANADTPQTLGSCNRQETHARVPLMDWLNEYMEVMSQRGGEK